MKCLALLTVTGALFCSHTVALAQPTVAPAASVAAHKLSDAGPYAVETLEFPDLVDQARARSVPLKVHMPGDLKACPVVIVSHGAGGSWDANYAQAHHLATHGYVVVCVEHVGSNTAVFRKGLRILQNLRDMVHSRDEVLGRPKDITFAIDQTVKWNRSDRRLQGRFDLRRIGVMGHSFGAYTTLVVCGARPALEWLEPAEANANGLGSSMRDRRIRCGVALSPQGPGEPYFLESSYRTIAIPLLGISGSRDKQQGRNPLIRKRGFELWPPKDKTFIWLEGADHTAFSDSTGSGRRGLPSRALEGAQNVSRAATLLFFNHHLGIDTTGDLAIDVETLRPYLAGNVTDIEVQHK